MVRSLKIIKWLFITCLATGILFVCAFAIYLETSIDSVLPAEEKKELFSAIHESQELPPLFKSTLKKYYPDFAEQGVWSSIFNQLTETGSRNSCQCRELYLPAYTANRKVKFSPLIVALEIEEHFTQWKCYEFEMATAYFGLRTPGIKEAALKFYNKALHELNEKEILELNLIRKSPTRYSPLHQKENLARAVNQLINRN